MMRRIGIAAALAAALMVGESPARADFTAKNALSSTFTFFAFTCFSTKTCQVSVPINSAGTEIFTSGAAGYVQFPSAQAVTQSGTWVTRAQDGSGNALTSALRGSERAMSVQIVDGSGTQVTSFGGSGGTASNFGSAFPPSGTAVGLTDGTNMQGWKNAANALNSTGAGIGAAQIVGQFDDISPTAITENQFGNLRMSANRNLYNTIRDAAGNERGANVDASNRLQVVLGSGSQTDLGSQADSAWVSGSGSAIAILKNIAGGISGSVPAGANRIGYISDDPCSQAVKVNAPISQTANAKIVTGASSKKTYICSLVIVGADAENLSIVEGTGSTCGTGTAAVIGGATAANGLNLPANGGWTQGSGLGSVASGATNATDVCLFQSGSGRVSGNLTYVQQ